MLVRLIPIRSFLPIIIDYIVSQTDSYTLIPTYYNWITLLVRLIPIRSFLPIIIDYIVSQTDSYTLIPTYYN